MIHYKGHSKFTYPNARDPLSSGFKIHISLTRVSNGNLTIILDEAFSSNSYYNRSHKPFPRCLDYKGDDKKHKRSWKSLESMNLILTQGKHRRHANFEANKRVLT